MAEQNLTVSDLTPPATINELCERAEVWANGYYRDPDGKPTGTAKNLITAMRTLRAVAGSKPPGELLAEAICDVQAFLVEQGVARQTVNDYCGRIRMVLRWAACPPRRWISSEAIHDMAMIGPLRHNRGKAREAPGISAVEWVLVAQTIAVADVQLGTMIGVHWYTGARPSEVVRMRKSEITERDGMLIYAPRKHKNAHRGKARYIIVGPNGQAILRPWMARVDREELFTIKTANGYYQAVKRINRIANIPQWCPAQIRHSHLTRIAGDNIDGARAVAGHSKLNMTLHYSEHDLRLATEIQQKFG